MPEAPRLVQVRDDLGVVPDRVDADALGDRREVVEEVGSSPSYIRRPGMAMMPLSICR